MPYDYWEAFQRLFVPDSGGQEETPVSNETGRGQKLRARPKFGWKA
jgi:hypothetical protein